MRGIRFGRRKGLFARRSRRFAGRTDTAALVWTAFGLGVMFSVGLWFGVHGGDTGFPRSSAPVPESALSDEVARVGNDGKDAGKREREGPEDGPENRSEGRLKDAEGKDAEGNGTQGGGSPWKNATVKVRLAETGEIETVSLEKYVQGVVAAEMPLEFRPAALEAQAIAARTYALRRLWSGESPKASSGEADVTDTMEDQVYLSTEKMNRLRQNDPVGWRKAADAAKATEGEVLVYAGEPIEALFFSTSNGYTENSEDVFPNKLPYLRSVASPWDKRYSPRARETIEMPLAEFYEKLGSDAVTAGKRASDKPSVRVLEWTEGRRIKRMAVGDLEMEGVEVRRRLGLRSASFDWETADGKIRLTVYGSGHGVGMSQWGAEGMARQGKEAREILAHYYRGAKIEQASKLSPRPGNGADEPSL